MAIKQEKLKNLKSYDRNRCLFSSWSLLIRCIPVGGTPTREEKNLKIAEAMQRKHPFLNLDDEIAFFSS